MGQSRKVGWFKEDPLYDKVFRHTKSGGDRSKFRSDDGRSWHMVFVLNQKGRVLARFGKRFGGEGLGEFRYPTQVVAAGGEIVILDSGNYRVQILDVRGHFLKQFGLSDVSNGTGLAMDGNGNIYVTDPQLNQLQVFSHSGQFLYKFGEAGTGVGQFNGHVRNLGGFGALPVCSR